MRNSEFGFRGDSLSHCWWYSYSHTNSNWSNSKKQCHGQYWSAVMVEGVSVYFSVLSGLTNRWYMEIGNAIGFLGLM
ncbi:MAG TPA: hypothetical protein VN763_12315 [Saprospiraceae bacterium]|nr:hypothetical protein [Saprospiraceae bacterium]